MPAEETQEAPRPGTPPSAELLQVFADGMNRALVPRLGASVDFPGGKAVRAVLPVRAAHLGGMGSQVVNGAVMASLFDLVIGCTAALVDPTRRAATMQLSMTFERPLEGETVTAEAWIDRAGSTNIFASAVLRNGAGEICARCQGLVRISSLAWNEGILPAGED